MTADSLDGRLVAITGAAGGVGVHLVQDFLQRGADVLAIDVDEAGAEKTAREFVPTFGDRVAHAGLDVTDATRARSVVEGLGRPVDVLVNAAGAWTFVPFADSTPEQWRRDIEINLVGTMTMTHVVLPGMTSQGRGRVVNIVSDSGRVGEYNVAAYSAAKAGVMGFTRSFAKEAGPLGVTANCVSLSLILTDAAHATYTSDQLDRMTRRYPAGRLGAPDDVAAAVAYFASDAAAWVTGQVLSVNGGYAML